MNSIKKLAKQIIKIYFNILYSPKLIYFVFEPIFWLKGFREKNKNFKNILIIKLDKIGDFILLTSTLRELRKNYINSRISIIVNLDLKNIVETCPYIDDYYLFKTDPQAIENKNQYLIPMLKFSIKYLWPIKYDLALIPRWDIDYYNSSYICYFSGANTRIGYSEKINSRKSKINKNYDFFLTNPVQNNEQIHEVKNNLYLIKQLNCSINDDKLELWDDRGDIEFANNILIKNNVIDKSRVLVLGVGSEEEKKRWSASNYIAISKHLINNYKFTILLLGSHKDIELSKTIEKEIPDNLINLAGKTTLRQAFSIIKLCKLYIGNDTGLMHMASAAAIPVIEISCHPINGCVEHYNSPKRFGPWGVKHIIFQPEIPNQNINDKTTVYKDNLINNIKVEDVLKGVKSLID